MRRVLDTELQQRLGSTRPWLRHRVHRAPSEGCVQLPANRVTADAVQQPILQYCQSVVWKSACRAPRPIGQKALEGLKYLSILRIHRSVRYGIRRTRLCSSIAKIAPDVAREFRAILEAVLASEL